MNLIHHTQSTRNDQQIHYSVSRSKTSQPGAHTRARRPPRLAHTLPIPQCENVLIMAATWEIMEPSRCLIWIRPLRIQQVMVSARRCHKSASPWIRPVFLRDLISQVWLNTSAVPNSGWAQREQREIHHLTHSVLLPHRRLPAGFLSSREVSFGRGLIVGAFIH